MAGPPHRRFISLENCDEAIPLLSAHSNPHKCVAVCQRLNVFWAIPKCVCTVWQERAIGNDSLKPQGYPATLGSQDLSALDSHLSHEGNHLLWRFFLQSETLGLFHTVSPNRSSGAHADLLGVWLAPISYHLSKWSSPMPSQFHLGHK